MMKKTIFVFAAVLMLASELQACPECSSFVGTSLVNCIKPLVPKLGLKNLLLNKLLTVAKCRRSPLLERLRYPYGGCQSSCLPYSRALGYQSSALLASPSVLAPTIASPYANYLGGSCDGCSTGSLCGDGCCSGLETGGCCCGNPLCGGGCGTCAGAVGTCGGCGGACSGIGGACGCGGACSGIGGACDGCGGACAGIGGTYGGCGGTCAECGGTCAGCGGTCAGCGGPCAGCGGLCSGCGGACSGPCGGCRGNCDDLCCGKRGSLFSGKMRTNCFEGGFSIGGC